jgi:protoheme IX farnesyltransferase
MFWLISRRLKKHQVSTLQSTETATEILKSSSKMKDFTLLLKLRLSWLVVFSAVTAYIMAHFYFDQPINWTSVIILTFGGFLVTGSSNAINQIIEKDLDKLMARTENRPMPQERLTNLEAIIFSVSAGILGVFLLWYFLNPLSGMLGIAALVSYVAIYTPLKRVTPFAVFVGAFPGAIPPMLGWVAFTGEMSLQALILFAIQFIWQFPHFWALAWMMDEDYKKAGFFMLPAADGRSRTSALQIMVYTAGIIPIGLLPFMFSMTGIVSAVITSICGIYFMFRAIKLHNSLEIADARKLLYASFIYLPIVQLALLFDTV